MRLAKRILSIVLALALVFTGMNFDGFSTLHAKAAENTVTMCYAFYDTDTNNRSTSVDFYYGIFKNTANPAFDPAGKTVDAGYTKVTPSVAGSYVVSIDPSTMASDDRLIISWYSGATAYGPINYSARNSMTSAYDKMGLQGMTGSEWNDADNTYYNNLCTYANRGQSLGFDWNNGQYAYFNHYGPEPNTIAQWAVIILSNDIDYLDAWKVIEKNGNGDTVIKSAFQNTANNTCSTVKYTNADSKEVTYTYYMETVPAKQNSGKVTYGTNRYGDTCYQIDYEDICQNIFKISSGLISAMAIPLDASGKVVVGEGPCNNFISYPMQNGGGMSGPAPTPITISFAGTSDVLSKTSDTNLLPELESYAASKGYITKQQLEAGNAGDYVYGWYFLEVDDKGALVRDDNGEVKDHYLQYYEMNNGRLGSAWNYDSFRLNANCIAYPMLYNNAVGDKFFSNPNSARQQHYANICFQTFSEDAKISVKRWDWDNQKWSDTVNEYSGYGNDISRESDLTIGASFELHDRNYGVSAGSKLSGDPVVKQDRTEELGSFQGWMLGWYHQVTEDGNTYWKIDRLGESLYSTADALNMKVKDIYSTYKLTEYAQLTFMAKWSNRSVDSYLNNYGSGEDDPAEPVTIVIDRANYSFDSDSHTNLVPLLEAYATANGYLTREQLGNGTKGKYIYGWYFQSMNFNTEGNASTVKCDDNGEVIDYWIQFCNLDNNKLSTPREDNWITVDNDCIAYPMIYDSEEGDLFYSNSSNPRNAYYVNVIFESWAEGTYVPCKEWNGRNEQYEDNGEQSKGVGNEISSTSTRSIAACFETINRHYGVRPGRQLVGDPVKKADVDPNLGKFEGWMLCAEGPNTDEDGNTNWDRIKLADTYYKSAEAFALSPSDIIGDYELTPQHRIIFLAKWTGIDEDDYFKNYGGGDEYTGPGYYFENMFEWDEYGHIIGLGQSSDPEFIPNYFSSNNTVMPYVHCKRMYYTFGYRDEDGNVTPVSVNQLVVPSDVTITESGDTVSYQDRTFTVYIVEFKGGLKAYEIQVKDTNQTLYFTLDYAAAGMYTKAEVSFDAMLQTEENGMLSKTVYEGAKLYVIAKPTYNDSDYYCNLTGFEIRYWQDAEEIVITDLDEVFTKKAIRVDTDGDGTADTDGYELTFTGKFPEEISDWMNVDLAACFEEGGRKWRNPGDFIISLERLYAGNDCWLGDDVNMNFYISLDNEMLKDTSTKVTFKVGTDTYVYTTADLKQMGSHSGGAVYRLACPIAPAQFADTITAKVEASGKVLSQWDYSFKRYADAILEDETMDQPIVDMVKAMLNYGGYAQQYFNYNTSNLVNRDLYATGENPVEQAGSKLIAQEKDSKQKTIQTYETAITDSITAFQMKGASLYGMSLVCEDKIAGKLYFTVNSGYDASKFAVNVSAKGYETEYDTEVQGNMIVVTLRNLSFQCFESEYTVELNYNNGSEKASVKYSVLGMLCRYQNKIPEKMNKLMQSIFQYYKAGLALDMYMIEREQDETEIIR